METPSKTVWKVAVDGASRGNPGNAGAGFWVTSGNRCIIKKGLYVGKRTNNQAEYLALAAALFYIHKKVRDDSIRFPQLHIISDSELLVKQMKGIYKIKNETLKNLYHAIQDLLKNSTASFTHVLRAYNVQADTLANHGITTRTLPLPSFISFISTYAPELTWKN